MRKTLLYAIVLIVMGIAAYQVGYRLYQINRLQPEIPKQRLLPKEVLQERSWTEEPYYLLKIEDKMLVIYRMPNGDVYDMVRIEGLQLQEEDLSNLTEGKSLEDLTEVFEFLENCMS